MKIVEDEEGEEEVTCDQLGLRAVPGVRSKKCRKNRVWSRYRNRCIPNFF